VVLSDGTTMGSVTLLIGRFQRGSSSAFGQLFRRFLPETERLASRRSRWPASRLKDGEDIAQGVFWELYRAVRQHRPLAAGLRDTTTLLKTLALLTRQHLRRRWRDETRLCRDVRRACGGTDLTAIAGADGLNNLFDDTGARWLCEVQSRETLEQLLLLLPEARYRKVVHLLLQGYTIAEVAREIHRGVRSVQRYLVEIRSIWCSHPIGREILSGCVPPG